MRPAATRPRPTALAEPALVLVLVLEGCEPEPVAVELPPTIVAVEEIVLDPLVVLATTVVLVDALEELADETVLVAVDEADEDAELADLVGAAPNPDLVRKAVDWEPTLPLSTQPTVLAWVSTTPTLPTSQQKPFPSLPMNRFQDESAQSGAPSTAPTQLADEEQQEATSAFLAELQKRPAGQ